MTDRPDYKYIAQLVELVQKKKSSDAFAEIYMATCEKQFRYSYNYLRDEYLAQDALQETYILAYQNINKLREPSVFPAWLSQINMHVCYDMSRKYKDQQEELSAFNQSDMDQQVSLLMDPEETYIFIDSCSFLAKQVMALPFMESQSILMKYYQNLKLEEIADLLDVSVSSVKRYLTQGRKHLKHRLSRD